MQIGDMIEQGGLTINAMMMEIVIGCGWVSGLLCCSWLFSGKMSECYLKGETVIIDQHKVGC